MTFESSKYLSAVGALLIVIGAVAGFVISFFTRNREYSIIRFIP